MKREHRNTTERIIPIQRKKSKKKKKIQRKKRNEATVFHKWSTASHVQSTEVNCIPG